MHQNIFFEGQSCVYLANALRIASKETGKASIAIMHDVLTGKDFFRDYSTITETTKDPMRKSVKLTWDQFVEDKITSRANNGIS